MKLLIESLNEFTIFLNKYHIKELNIKDKEQLEKYFRKLFSKIKRCYNLELCGYYNIEVYIDNVYGMILDVYRLDSEYIKIFGNKVDLKITFNQNSKFLFETNDFFLLNKLNKDKIKVYKIKNKYYFEIYQDIEESKFMYLLENTKLIYGKEVKKVLNKSILINNH